MPSEVMTVRGWIPADALGKVLPHEHLFCDDTAWWTGDSNDPLAHAPVTLDLYGEIARNPQGVTLDNLVVDDEELIVDEVLRFKQAGGQTLVDLTLMEIGARPDRLPGIAEETGLNIIAGCGYYIEATYPDSVGEMSEDELTDDILRQIHEGLGHSGILPGVIGEIGTSSPITPNEKKCLRAAARAQAESGLGLTVHVHPWQREAPEALRIVLEAGADPGRTVISHLDGILDLEYHLGLAESGVFVEFDIFGAETFYDEEDYFLPTDRERVHHIIELVRRGYLKQILISQDICYKIKLCRYGGWGYAHILKHIVPMFRRYGLEDEEIRMIVEENPRRWLAGA